MAKLHLGSISVIVFCVRGDVIYRSNNDCLQRYGDPVDSVPNIQSFSCGFTKLLVSNNTKSTNLKKLPVPLNLYGFQLQAMICGLNFRRYTSKQFISLSLKIIGHTYTMQKTFSISQEIAEKQQWITMMSCVKAC